MAFDVIIIGGGVIGLSIARSFHKSGYKNILVLDQGMCGREASWAAAGMLGPQAEANAPGVFLDICSIARDLHPVFAEQLLDETDIDVELDRSGTLYLAFTAADLAVVEERFRWQNSTGLAVEYFTADEARRAEPFISPDVLAALYFPNDWQLENRKLMAALRKYAELNEIEIRENCKVERLIKENSKIIGAQTSHHRFHADHLIIATGAWTSYIKTGIDSMPFEIEPIKGQIIAFRTAKRLFGRVIYTPRGYLVPRRDGRILAGSTSENAGFDKTVTGTARERLHSMASEIAPGLARLAPGDQWSGLRPFPPDGMPLIGQINGLSGLFLATGHYRNGILLAPWTADAIVSAVSGESLKIPDAFNPNRFSFASWAPVDIQCDS